MEMAGRIRDYMKEGGKVCYKGLLYVKDYMKEGLYEGRKDYMKEGWTI
jgi:hypothetical protein